MGKLVIILLMNNGVSFFFYPTWFWKKYPTVLIANLTQLAYFWLVVIQEI
ncbi:MAG: hypothetical protein AB1394_07300 [Bacteroidota bacterium]